MSAFQQYFTTNIIDPNCRIVSLSDIHGDIQSLIISLRDCAKVIRKKNNILFNQNIYDNDLERELQKNLNTPNHNYIEDLNYEWIGTNTYVVICGDIIDPSRTNNCKKNNNHNCNYYPQIELKILMFINALNRQNRQNGRIIKILGNHEVMNLFNTTVEKNYIDPEDLQEPNYYNNVNRYNIFNVGQYGFKLLFEGGCGLMVKINNKIFVHGNLNASYNYYNSLNQWINDPQNQNLNPNPQNINEYKWINDSWNDLFNNKNTYSNVIDTLWDRKNGLPQNMSLRIYDKYKKLDDTSSDTFCTELNNLFISFLANSNLTDNPKDLILIVGHCIQADTSISELNGYTYDMYDHTNSNDTVSVFNQNHTHIGKSQFITPPNETANQYRNRIFGITMECKKSNSNNIHSVYRVDVGTSRGFDMFNGTGINIPGIENKFLFSRTPQVLVFENNNTVNIIKSTMKNTRIHLPRPEYETIVNTIPALNIHDPTNLNYKKKYLKYKNKYLQLKKLL
jgi:hypothetical protein